MIKQVAKNKALCIFLNMFLGLIRDVFRINLQY